MPDTRTRRQKLEDMARRGTPPERQAARAKLKAMGSPPPKEATHRTPFRMMEAQRGPEPLRPRGWAYLGEVEITTRKPKAWDAERRAQAAIDRVFKPFGITNRDPD